MNRSKVRAFDAMVRRYPDAMPLDAVMRGNRAVMRLCRARVRAGWRTWRSPTLLQPVSVAFPSPVGWSCGETDIASRRGAQ